jgi:uncharacterized protein
MDLEIALFAGIGFLAQIVDGALGMAFGVIATSSLLASGLPPAVASAATHAAEVVTTGLSGASHLWHGNVDRGLFLRLVLTGVPGGIAGAYLLSELPEAVGKPFVTLYLAAMALLILARLLGRARRVRQPPVPLLGVGGGFFDALGGGGWGSLVNAGLIATGEEPRRSIGSVNLAEFFVATAVSATFLLRLDLALYGSIVLGLILGGAVAAPLAGLLVKVLPARALLVLVALILGALCLVNLYALLA